MDLKDIILQPDYIFVSMMARFAMEFTLANDISKKPLILPIPQMTLNIVYNRNGSTRPAAEDMKIRDGDKTGYLTIKKDGNTAYSEVRYILPDEF